MKKQRVLYISPNRSTFVARDIKLLSRHYQVDFAAHNWQNKTLLPLTALRQLFFLLFRLPGAQAVFIMFAGYWSLLPVYLAHWLGKPSYIILGGTECVSFPQIAYGSLRKASWRRVIKASVQRATRLLPVHASLMDYQDDYFGSGAQGLLHFFPQLTVPYTVIHNGFDADLWPFGEAPQAQQCISVGYVHNERQFKLKGFDLIYAVAPHFPEMIFHLVGMSPEFLAGHPAPANVTVHQSMPQEDFLPLLQNSQYYFQLSVSEGFPNAVCEAMLTGCIPIASTANALPEIIGDTGFLLAERELDTLKQILAAAFSLDQAALQNRSQAARAKIIRDYPLAKREKELLDILQPMT